ncbi:MAG: ABC transporter permease subunit [Streptosporangiaceae bacterium]|nr:ABC transporter permease subunit [Streptosporangiaceae bacterium]
MTALLHAEWTKLRTVRGWVIAMLFVPIMTVGLSALISSGSECGYQFPGPNGQMLSGGCSAPTGPGGELVQDKFYFVHQALAGNGSITARITALTSSNLQPWAKAGIIIKANTVPGSAYAAMMVTGARGVRMQWNFTQDTAGMPGAHWLRLVRSGDTITGYDSADGARWTKVGAVTLGGLRSTAQVGLFATTPQPQSGAAAVSVGQTVNATGTFDQIIVAGATRGSWAGTSIGEGPDGLPTGAYQQTGAGLSVSGHGDIAPDTGEGAGGTATPISHTLDGLFAGMIVAIVLGTSFITAEYRRGMIRTTLAACPRRGRVLAAKAVVAGAATFAAGFIGCAIAEPLGSHLLRSHGNVLEPVTSLTLLRVEAGTAAVFAATAVLGVALGAVFRRGADAVTTAIVVVIVPWFLAVSSPALPTTVADWLLRVSPSAALAIQQTIPRYPQVISDYAPHDGFFPLAPLAGFAVLCAWTAAALWLAARLLRRRDA